MDTIADRRCFHHEAREAAARCPRCRRYFCRECVTEHDDQFVCASCLNRAVGILPARRRLFPGLDRMFRILLGILLAWGFFYLSGRVLLTLPQSFHAKSIWHLQE